MFHEREKFIVLVRQAVGREKPIRDSLARDSRSGSTSSFNEISGKRRVTAIRSDNRKGIRRAELSILLYIFIFFFLFYDCELNQMNKDEASTNIV